MIKGRICVNSYSPQSGKKLKNLYKGANSNFAVLLPGSTGLNMTKGVNFWLEWCDKGESGSYPELA